MMKRIVVCAVLLLMLFSVMIQADALTLTTTIPRTILGDVDSDSEISIIDATWIQRMLAYFAVPDTFNEKAADVDGDNEVTVLDATLIQRYLAGMNVSFPINEYI